MQYMFKVRAARAPPSNPRSWVLPCALLAPPPPRALPALDPSCDPLRKLPFRLGRTQSLCPTQTKSSRVAHGRVIPSLTIVTVRLGAVWAHARPRHRRRHRLRSPRPRHRRRHRPRSPRHRCLRPALPAMIQRSSGPTGWPTMCASSRCPCIRTTRQELPAPQDTTKPSDPATLTSPAHKYPLARIHLPTRTHTPAHPVPTSPPS